MDIFYPFSAIATWLVEDVFRITNTTLAGSVHFFVYDTLKIFFLTIIITSIMSLLRYYLPIEKLRDFLISHKLYGLEYLLATIFGAITPFCSCSSIPLFIGFVQARIPLGITFAFLITSPLNNEVAIGLFIGLFGLHITLLYIAAGIAIGVLGGWILGKMNMEKYVAEFVWKLPEQKGNTIAKITLPKKEIARIVSKEAMDITKKIALYILAGVGIGAFIHGYVPQEFFETYLQKAGIWGVPLAVILAVPLYSNASGVIPIIQSLIAKGVPIGTGLAFMMAVVGLSLPEALILKKVLKWQLLASFFGIVTVGIIMIGYLFNGVL
ncbi:MAG TPA: permease [Candidatus Magasanikbacteria bacterium]|nr:permease [Candidatus Magasanikbacteria bacterium]